MMRREVAVSGWMRRCCGGPDSAENNNIHCGRRNIHCVMLAKKFRDAALCSI